RIRTYAYSMDPAGPERLRGFRAPGADLTAGSPSPAQTQTEGSAPPQPPTTAGDTRVPPGKGWRWAIAAAGVLVVAVVIIAALAFKLGSGSAPSAHRAFEPSTPSRTPAATAPPLPVTEMYRQVVPSLVMIT